MLPSMDAPPERLKEALADRYPLERELGRGGMATVYLGRDLKHDRPVAVKVLLSEYAEGLGNGRFLREIDIAARMTHPHILPLHDSGEAAGFLYYVMPYVSGESLHDRIAREAPLPVDEAVMIARNVADALDYAHKEGIVHRDIKPANIFLIEGEAVVADFGVARAITAAAGQERTSSGAVVGTPQYMSPEQGASDADITGRSDIYALGCVLHEMLTGERVFSARTPLGVIAQHMCEPPVALRTLRPGAPEWLEEVVRTALAKLPVDRFKTAGDFSRALASGTAVRRPARAVKWRTVALGLAAVLATLAIFAPPGMTNRLDGAAGPPLTQVAVLYFDDQSGDGQLEQVSARITEEVIRALTQVRALHVISAVAIRPYPAGSVSLSDIVQEFGVGTIVAGTVSGTLQEAEVAVELIDPTTQIPLASAVVFGVHDDLDLLVSGVGSEIADRIRLWVGEELRLRDRRARTDNEAAWNLTERAAARATDGSELAEGGDTAAAARAFQRADSLLGLAGGADPDWVWPRVQRAHVAYARARDLAPRDQGYDRGQLMVSLGHLDRALSMEPSDPAALEHRGRVLAALVSMSDDEMEADSLRAESERTLLSAAGADSTWAADVWSRLSRLYIDEGRLQEAKLAAIRAYEGEHAFPSDMRLVLFDLCSASLDLQDWEDVSRWCGEGRRRYQSSEHFVGVDLVALAGPEGPEADVGKAWELSEQFLRLSPEATRPARRSQTLMQVAAVLARAGHPDSARAVLAQASADDTQRVPRTDYFEANVRLQLGEEDRAVGLLDSYLDATPSERSYLTVDWWWDRLREHQGFQRLLEPPS